MANKARPFEKDLEELKQIYGEVNDYSEAVYLGAKHKIKVICKRHGEFHIVVRDHLMGRGCQKCRLEDTPKVKLIKWIALSKEKHGDKYDYSKSLYSGSRGLITIICPEHGEFEQFAESHKLGHGCMKCYSDTLRFSLEDVLLGFEKAHGETYDYSLVNYIDAKTKVDIICRKHGLFSVNPHNHKNGVGCPKCKSSKGELAILKYLDSRAVYYEREWVIGTNPETGCNLFIDFYLPYSNIAIEFDGPQHEKPVNHFGGKETFFKVIYRDQIKEMLCENLGIYLIRIPYKDLDIVEEILDFYLEQSISYEEIVEEIREMTEFGNCMQITGWKYVEESV